MDEGGESPGDDAGLLEDGGSMPPRRKGRPRKGAGKKSGKSRADEATPMMVQWHKAKEEHPDALLMFRMGDFYESFYEDAKVIAGALGLTLTSRDKKDSDSIPLAGIPHHALETYMERLIRLGYKVAICEQMEDPKLAKGLVKREVVRVVTPGTLMEEKLLDTGSNNFLLSATIKDPQAWSKGSGKTTPGIDQELVGGALADVSTGEVLFFDLEDSRLERLGDEIARFRPRELIVPISLTTDPRITSLGTRFGLVITGRPETEYEDARAEESIREVYGVTTVDGYDLADLSLRALGGLLSYLQHTQRQSLPHLTPPKRFDSGSYMILDDTTLRNLEVTRTIRDLSKAGSLLGTMDSTCTSMGARLLANWLVRPLLEPHRITARLDAVDTLYKGYMARASLRELLSGMGDMERLIGKVSCGRATPRDMKALRVAQERLPTIRTELEGAAGDSKVLAVIARSLDPLNDLVDLLSRALVDDPPNALREGGIFREGYNEELDTLRHAEKNGKTMVAALEARERGRTDIKSLKVKFNRVFGYFIEVSNTHQAKVPEDYIVKQTLVNCQRYITPDLKEMENTILGAEEKAKALEQGLFEQLRESVANRTTVIQTNAKALARLDVLCSFAETAKANGYVRPEVDGSDILEVHDSRHPVIESTIPERFVPNNALFDGARRFVVLTGPNMAGKSTYMRQVAIVALLAQVGSFVPAKKAHIGVLDRIFTRVGASDDISRGQSTFMVEMVELANILHNATDRSLVLLDEIGRGTATFDGLSIAWAVSEHLGKVGSKTIFATHYHQMVELEKVLPSARNLHIAVKEQGEEILFIRKVKEGGMSRSYGVEVARLAGLPREVITRARDVLRDIEADNVIDVKKGSGRGAGHEEVSSSDVPGKKGVQVVFFQGNIEPLSPVAEKPPRTKEVVPDDVRELLDALRSVDTDGITPRQALDLLTELSRRSSDLDPN